MVRGIPGSDQSAVAAASTSAGSPPDTAIDHVGSSGARGPGSNAAQIDPIRVIAKVVFTERRRRLAAPEPVAP